MNKNEFIITLEDIPIQVIRKRVKNINLRIYPPAGLVRMSIPWRLSEAQARQFLDGRLAWIKAHQKRMLANPKPLLPKLVSGSLIPYLGQEYTLQVEVAKGRAITLLDSTTMLLEVKRDDDQAVCQKILDEWYRQQLKAAVPDLIDRWEPIIGYSVRGWTIRKMRSKWGSCNVGKRHINLNLALAKGPPECLEMVLVHEMVHFLERRHNRRFYKLMDQFLPGWRHADELLQQIPLAPRRLD